MEFIVINRSFGRDSKNLVNEINLKSFQGAMSALETFYYSFLTRFFESRPKLLLITINSIYFPP